MINRPIQISFDSKYPFPANQILSRGQNDKIPSVVMVQGVKFSLDGCAPMRVAKSLGDGVGFDAEGLDMEVKLLRGLIMLLLDWEMIPLPLVFYLPFGLTTDWDGGAMSCGDDCEVGGGCLVGFVCLF